MNKIASSDVSSNQGHTWRKTMTLLTVIVMDVLVGMEFDLFLPSFPELQTRFNLSPFWVEALLSINFIGYCLSVFGVGVLSDRWGRKPLIVAGLLIFCFGSVLCVYSPYYNVLLLGRFLQGVGIASPAILSFLIIADLYPLKQQQFWMGVLNGVMNLSIGLAPVLGSYIALYFNAEGNFKALLWLGVLTFFLTLILIRKNPSRSTRERPVSPVVPMKELMREKPLFALVTHIVIQIVPYWIFVGLAPLLYLRDLGVSLKVFGFYQGSFALVFALGSVVSGFLVNRYSSKRLMDASLWIFMASLVTTVCAVLTKTTSPLWITLSFMPFVIGQILPTTVLYTLALNWRPEAKGRISAVLQGGRLIVSAIFLQWAGHLYTGTFQVLGLILLGFIVLTILTLIYVVRSKEIMERA